LKLWKSGFQTLYGGTSYQQITSSDFCNAQFQQVMNFYDFFIERKIGVGDMVLLWENDWGLGLLKYQYPTLFSFALDQKASVDNVYHSESFDQLFRQLTSYRAIEEFNLLLPLITVNLFLIADNCDELIWKRDDKEILTVKSVYFTMKDGPRTETFIHRI
jgi:hypothetical protein